MLAYPTTVELRVADTVLLVQCTVHMLPNQEFLSESGSRADQTLQKIKTIFKILYGIAINIFSFQSSTGIKK